MDLQKVKGVIEDTYNLKIEAFKRLTGGEKNEVYHLTNSPYVLRIYQKSANRDGIRFEHQLLTMLAEKLPYISAPLVTGLGSFIEIDGQPISLMGYIDGYTPSRADCNENLCHQAGLILGEIHKQARDAGKSLPQSHYRKSLCELDFYSNDMYDWDKAYSWLSHTEFQRELPYLKESLDFFEKHFKSAKNRYSNCQPIHGDYYNGNLLCRNGQIVGVIDFDDTKLEFPEYEVARSVWEFARDDASTGFNDVLKNSYLSGYTSVEDFSVEETDLYAFIDFVRIFEILSNATSMIDGDLLVGFDWEYNRVNLKWSKKLRDALK